MDNFSLTVKLISAVALIVTAPAMWKFIRWITEYYINRNNKFEEGVKDIERVHDCFNELLVELDPDRICVFTVTNCGSTPRFNEPLRSSITFESTSNVKKIAKGGWQDQRVEFDQQYIQYLLQLLNKNGKSVSMKVDDLEKKSLLHDFYKGLDVDNFRDYLIYSGNKKSVYISMHFSEDVEWTAEKRSIIRSKINEIKQIYKKYN